MNNNIQIKSTDYHAFSCFTLTKPVMKIMTFLIFSGYEDVFQGTCKNVFSMDVKGS